MQMTEISCSPSDWQSYPPYSVLTTTNLGFITELYVTTETEAFDWKRSQHVRSTRTNHSVAQFVDLYATFHEYSYSFIWSDWPWIHLLRMLFVHLTFSCCVQSLYLNSTECATSPCAPM